MTTRTPAPRGTDERDQQARGGATRGRLLVTDYVGQTAADAAQAIRRAGLRPGLERSLGCEPELFGQVVAQEPPAGSELARNAMVTLYVAAPGAAAADDAPAGQAAPSSQPAVPASATAEQAFSAGNGIRQAKPTLRRRRKPRPAERSPRFSDTPPAPVRPEADLAHVASSVLTDGELTKEWVSHDEPLSAAPDTSELREETLDEYGDHEKSHEKFVVHADNVFAGRAGVTWRRVYPLRSRLTSSGNQRHRRWRR
jgi:hypothetical protein